MESVNIQLVEHLATVEKPFHFKDCGLDNVYLVGIRYFEKSDGQFIAEIPAIQQLMHMIARSLVFSDSELDGKEIRFLRKRLGYKSSDFAKCLSLDISTFSRIENEKQASSAQVSKLTKLAYTLLCKDPEPELAEHRKLLAQLFLEEIKVHREARIVKRVSADNEWSDLPIAA